MIKFSQFLNFKQLVSGGWVGGWVKAGYNLDRSPVHHKAEETVPERDKQPHTLTVQYVHIYGPFRITS